MDIEKAALVICITLFLVIGLNAMIYYSVIKKGGASQVDIIKRAASQIRNPWESEDSALQALSSIVEKMKNPKDEQSQESHSDKPR